jgi:hypothetical protein
VTTGVAVLADCPSVVVRDTKYTDPGDCAAKSLIGVPNADHKPAAFNITLFTRGFEYGNDVGT